MKGDVSRAAVRLSGVAALLMGLFLARIGRADAGAPPTVDGGGCVDSSGCASPTPHCHDVLHTCVQCLADANCATGVCDDATGACVACRSDRDCPADRPYCDAGGSGACVECLGDGNCTLGQKCGNGRCGTCGDGVCGVNERIRAFTFGMPEDGPSITQCPEDCLSACPTVDLKSATGAVNADLTHSRPLFSGDCGPDGVNTAVRWTAPKDGTFFANVPVAAGDYLYWSVVGTCDEYPNGCSGTTGDESGVTTIQLDVTAGQVVVLLLTWQNPPAASLAFEITDQPPGGWCSGPLCGPGGVPDAGAEDASAADQGRTQCLANAAERGEPVCDGTECVCEHCPQDYDDCGVIPGCAALRACMTAKGCVGADCYNSGKCRSEVDSAGGLSGPAFRAAAALQSCQLTFDCALPCAGGAEDAGATGRADAGQLCEPGRKVACACDGGTGTRTCDADGQGFGDCSCGEPEVSKSTTTSCGCRLAGTNGGSGSSLAALSLAALLASRRRARRSGARP